MSTRLPQLALLPGLFCALTACGPDYVKRYDKPLSYAQAIMEKDIDFPLPPSSRNIYHGMYADWQAYTRLVRIEAPQEDCLKHIDAVIAWNDKKHQRTSSYPRIQVAYVAPVGAGRLERASWFDPEKITRGIYTGDGSSHKPQIWIDLDRGIFYFQEMD